MMPETPLDFAFSPDLDVDALIRQLRQSPAFQEEAEAFIQRTYFDSFDWRLYAEGFTLNIESTKQGMCLNLHQEKRGGAHDGLRIHQVPRFVRDFPDGPIRSKLAPILEMRALLPVAEIHCRCRRLKWLNKDRKTVLRLRIEQNRVADPDSGKTLPLQGLVRIVPVKGYQKPVKQVRHALHNNPALTPANNHQLLRALTALGRKPLDYSSKLSVQLEPQMRSDIAGQKILRHLLAAMKVNEAGVRADLDSEFLHDFRVAVRRTRSLLSQFKGIFPVHVIERFGPRFAWLGRITGPTRDLDVYLLNFDHYKASIPLSMRDDLDPFHEFLQQRQKQAHHQLVQALDSVEYRQLMDEWNEFLETPLPQQPTAEHARLPIKQLARRRIWRVYRRILNEGRAITPESPAEALHELRKQCKKLRYLMEFFQSLFPKHQIKQLIKILKGLQDNLGEYQDVEVQQLSLRDFSKEMIAAASVPAETLLAMGVLVQNLETRRQCARNAFANRFAEFETRAHRALFKKMFANPGREDGTR